jgi:SagB-type dehydrogenase family enzyme
MFPGGNVGLQRSIFYENVPARELLSALFRSAQDLREAQPLTPTSARQTSRPSRPGCGALHPTHVYAAVLQPGDLATGVYHYDPPAHELECVKPLPSSETAALFATFPVHPYVVDLGSAAALFFITSKFWRSRAKYGPRGYRYCLQEAGSACQNLCLAAVAFDLAHVVLGGFYDDEFHQRLEIDGVDHGVITTIAVGAPAAQPKTEPTHVEL